MTVGQLVDHYESLVGEQCRSRNKQYLVRRIAWRLQANEAGGLSAAAIERAGKLAFDADLRLTAPRETSTSNLTIVEPEPNGFIAWESDCCIRAIWTTAALHGNGKPRVRCDF